jgi:hypothetical protein
MENANHKCTVVSVSIISFPQVRSPVLAAPLPIPSVFYFHIPSVAQLATYGTHWSAIWLHEVKSCQIVWLLAK